MEISCREFGLEIDIVVRKSGRDKAVTKTTVIVELAANTARGEILTGTGEATYSKAHGENHRTVRAFYDRLIGDDALRDLDLFNFQEFEERLARYPGNMAAKSGLDIAFHDLHAKHIGLPLYQWWGLDPARAPSTSYTVERYVEEGSATDLAFVLNKVDNLLARGFDILKLKVGTASDARLLESVRKHAPQAIIRADANAAWTLEESLKLCPVLAEQRVELLEEPLRLDSSEEDYQRLKEASPIPLVADESCHTSRDLVRCAKHFDGVNVKLAKTGGLREAVRLIHAALSLNLKVMLGCFCGTSVATTAAGHLASLVDYLDLDGSLLVKNDPYRGHSFDGNRLLLPTAPGVGAIGGEAFSGE